MAQGTAEMADLLEQVRDCSAADLSDAFQSSVQADHLARLAIQAPSLPVDIQRTRELLNAGRTQEAIILAEHLVGFIDQIQPQPPPQERLMLYHLLGICYTRQGEQANCQLNHNEASCIVPIKPMGQHVAQEGSRRAIAVYQRILAEFPDDLTARWLLNVASMTVGEYPQGVADRWLIPPQAFRSTDSLPAFHDIAGPLGVDLGMETLAGGTCMEDFNNDGFLDLMVSSWSLYQQIELLLSNGDGTFTNVTERSGLTGITGGLNMVQADYDNDGDADVLVLRGAWVGSVPQPNSLLRNNGDGTFEDVTRTAGLLVLNNTQAAAWGDYDNDGWLDLFIGQESSRRPLPCQLFHNNRDGTFTDMAPVAGVATVGFIKGVAIGDVNNDGYLDIYVSDLGGPNRLFMNQGPDGMGQWRFLDMARDAGVTLPKDGFPTWMWDYDNDGWLDIFCSAYSAEQRGSYASNVAAGYLDLPFPAEKPKLYRNRGNGRFADETTKAGLDLPLFTMGSNFGDLDNDGFPDFYLATGEPDLRSIIPNRMFRNHRDGSFRDVTTAGGFGHLQKGHGVAFGDLDNDGDQDIYVNLGGAYEGDGYQNALFENPGMGASWTTLFLEGTKSARCALHARIRVTVRTPRGDRDIYAMVGTGGSFGASSLRQEIGLGDALAIERIEVTWPATNQKQVFIDPPMDKPLKLVEGSREVIELELPVLHWKLDPHGAASGHDHVM